MKHLFLFSFCRRRLPVVMLRSKMAESIKTATQLIEQVNQINSLSRGIYSELIEIKQNIIAVLQPIASI